MNIEPYKQPASWADTEGPEHLLDEIRKNLNANPDVIYRFDPKPHISFAQYMAHVELEQVECPDDGDPCRHISHTSRRSWLCSCSGDYESTDAV